MNILGNRHYRSWSIFAFAVLVFLVAGAYASAVFAPGAPGQMAYFFSLLITFVMTGFLAWVAWGQRDIPAARPFFYLEVSECAQTLFELLSLTSPNTTLAGFWFNMRYLSTAVIAAAWILFALVYTGRGHWITWRALVAVFILPLATQILLWTNPLHSLWMKQDVLFIQIGRLLIADTTTRVAGLGYLVHAFYASCLWLTGIILIFIAARKTWKKSPWQSILLASGALVGFLTAIVPAFNIFPTTGFNPYTPGIGASALLFSLAIFRYEFLRKAPENSFDKDDESYHSLVLFVFVFILLASSLAASLYLSYHNYEEQFSAQVQEQLIAIASLKVDELQNWRRERMADAKTISNNPAFVHLVRLSLQKNPDVQAQKDLMAWLELFHSSYDYDKITMLDPQGNPQISLQPDAEELSGDIRASVAQVILSREVLFVDLHQDASANAVRMGLVVPIPAGKDSGPLVGVILMRMDPNTYLFQYLNTWPSSSQSEETLLLRRDGNEAVLLNNLRNDRLAAFNMRVPISQNLLEVRAVLGKDAIWEGPDYRGVNVLAAIEPVPDTNWVLVSRIDSSEVYAPLRQRAWEILALFVALLAGGGLGLGGLWRQQRLRYFQERFQAAENLQRSQQQYKELVEHAPDGIFIADANGRYIDVNPAGCALLGYTRDELLALTIKELIAPEDVSVTPPRLDELRVKKSIRAERRLLRKDGSLVTVEISGHVLPNGNFQSIVRDITERKQAEQELMQKEELLRLTGEMAHVGGWEFNVSTLKGSWTEEVARIHDMDPNEPTNAEIGLKFYTADSREKIEQAIKEATEEGIPYDLELEIISARGVKKWVRTQGVPVMENGKVVRLQGTFQDITERKKNEIELKRSNAELEQFAYVASHDLQEPLRMITSYAQLLARRYESQLDSNAREYIHYMEEGALRMKQLINDLLTYSRINTRGRPPQLINVQSILNEVLHEMSVTIEESRARITCDTLPEVCADPIQLRQLFQNLISNAIKFCEIDTPVIQISAQDLGAEWRFAVHDNGIGIEPRFAERIFVIFQRLHTREEYPGTGIGLAVCKRIVERHGGRIWVESEPKQGSTFFFTLPRQENNCQGE